MEDVWWKQRLESFDRAVNLLTEAVGEGVDEMSDLEKEGTVRRFELALELAWRTLESYLEFSGIVLRPTPRAVIKEAVAAGIVDDGQVWIDMLKHRSFLSQTCDENMYRQTIGAISGKYLQVLSDLRDWMKEKA